MKKKLKDQTNMSKKSIIRLACLMADMPTLKPRECKDLVINHNDNDTITVYERPHIKIATIPAWDYMSMSTESLRALYLKVKTRTAQDAINSELIRRPKMPV